VPGRTKKVTISRCRVDLSVPPRRNSRHPAGEREPSHPPSPLETKWTNNRFGGRVGGTSEHDCLHAIERYCTARARALSRLLPPHSPVSPDEVRQPLEALTEQGPQAMTSVVGSAAPMGDI